ncbi:MAG TPA: phosphate ABC transporter permease, partial [Desulfobacterales bacterium]|nr:phosphate ABC transporter permease [Desulfobacterales bacterium]
MKPDFSNRLFNYFSWGCSILLIGAVLTIISFLIANGYNVLSLHLIFDDTRPLDAIFLKTQVFDGLFPAIAGTVFLILLSILFAVPIGLATGIFLAEY